MTDRSPATVTRLLQDWRQGDATALARLLPLVYEELKAIAGNYRRMESKAMTMPATALVHEAFLRLAQVREIEWQDRGHFLCVAARVIRNLLVDQARRRKAGKRGSGAAPLELLEGAAVAAPPDVDLILLETALQELEQLDARQSQVVELRFFTGLNVEETAEAMGISTATVKREWAMARAWIYRRMQGG